MAKTLKHIRLTDEFGGNHFVKYANSYKEAAIIYCLTKKLDLKKTRLTEYASGRAESLPVYSFLSIV